MKWLVQTLNTLAAHGVNPIQEQTQLEELISRYQYLLLKTLVTYSSNGIVRYSIAFQFLCRLFDFRYKKLIPIIEMTVVRTELYSKCYTYKREVSEVRMFDFDCKL